MQPAQNVIFILYTMYWATPPILAKGSHDPSARSQR